MRERRGEKQTSILIYVCHQIMDNFTACGPFSTHSRLYGGRRALCRSPFGRARQSGIRRNLREKIRGKKNISTSSSRKEPQRGHYKEVNLTTRLNTIPIRAKGSRKGKTDRNFPLRSSHATEISLHGGGYANTHTKTVMRWI